AKQNETRAVIWGNFLLPFFGGGFNLFNYGPGAAKTGIICIVAGLLPNLFIFPILNLLDWIVKKGNEE
ncbi:MAG: hypothetical protein K8R77_01995, partial [Anaerolineaceae bacterium]|nr:hypothetical protein [Anaerolineaceae bacterium]